MSFEDIKPKANLEFDNQMDVVTVGQSKFKDPIQANKLSDWVKLNALPQSFTCTYECDEYKGPFGNGFILKAFVQVSGKIYRRMQNKGPETYFTQDWEDVTGEV